jgi:putative hydrolase of the HAD superfamily
VSFSYVSGGDGLRLASRPLPWTFDSRPGRSAAAPAAPARHGHRGIVLDLDDTLYPRERFVLSGFAAVARHAAAAHGVAADVAYALLVRARAGAGRGHELQALCRRFDLPPSLVPALVDVYRRHMPSLWLNHGVADALHALRASGWGLAVLTHGLPSVQFRKVAALGVALLVDEVVYADEHAAGGQAAAFQAAFDALELRAEQCVFVGGDPDAALRGARHAGMLAIRVARPGITTPADDADLVIEGFTQLPEAARGLLETVTAHVA